MCLGLDIKSSLFLSDLMKHMDIFSKNTQISSFVEIRPVGAEFYADGRTDGLTYTTRLIVAFRNFENATKMISNVPLPILPREKLNKSLVCFQVRRKEVWFIC
jgi:hypothetical protein